MMAIFQRALICSIILLVIVFGGPTLHVSAADLFGAEAFSYQFQTQKRQPTIVEIEQPQPFLLGDHPTIVVRLMTYAHRKPIANQPIRIYVNGAQKATGYTDSNGVAYALLKYDFPSGSYELRAKFPGSAVDDFEPSTDTSTMTIQTASAEIRTVPVIEGVRIVFDDQTYVSDKNGLIHMTIKKSGMHHMQVLKLDAGAFPRDVRVDFDRWNDNVFTPERDVYFPRSRPLEVGFIIHHTVSQLFYDSSGQEVDPSRITSISIGGVGQIYDFENSGPHWLPSNRLVRRIGERLESQQILYYLRNVSIDGVNVINKSQQRFYTRPQSTWPIKVLLYSAHFLGRDALFGFPIGDGIRIEYPNGKFKEYPFDSQAEVKVPALARGQYKIRVVGAGGTTPDIPVYLSRDQSVQLIVISYLDMIVIFGTPTLIALALLIVGRPRLFSVSLRELRKS